MNLLSFALISAVKIRTVSAVIIIIIPPLKGGIIMTADSRLVVFGGVA